MGGLVLRSSESHGLTRVAALLVCAACIALTTASAAGATTIPPFGSEGQGAGQFVAPSGIAVDQESGDLYIADRANQRVDKFGPQGEFLLAWGWGVANGAAEPQACGPAAVPATATCQIGLPGEGSGEFGEQGPVGLAVDNDPLDGSHGDVYVEDGINHRVEKFGPEGRFILMFGGAVDRTTEADVCLAAEECQAGTAGSEPGQFVELLATTIAVDPAGTVYVADEVGPNGENGRIQEFSEGGVHTGEVTLANSGGIFALAVASSEELYVLSELLAGVHEFNASGAEVGVRDEAAPSFSSVLAIGPADELFVYNGESGHVLEYSSSGAQLASIPTELDENADGMVFANAVDGLYILYRAQVRFAAQPPPGPLVVSESANATQIVTGASLEAVVNPEGHETTYHFEYGTTEAYVASTAEEPLPGGEGFEDASVSASVTNLQPLTTYHFRVVAQSECEPVEHPGRICTTDGPDETFRTLPPVSIEGESVSHVTDGSAQLEAALDPNRLSTEFFFEYGHTASYEARIPITSGKIGALSVVVPVNVLLEGLTSGSTYHFRVVAHNVAGTVTGTDQVFTTQVGGAAHLIDGRRWEMVSPPEKHGSLLESLPDEGGAIIAAQDGSAFAYIAKAPIDIEPAGNRSLADQQLLATRSAGGWTTQDIATPHESVSGLVPGNLSEYKLFSPNLSLALVEPEGPTLLSAEATERTPYIRHDDTCSNEPQLCFEPLVTAGNVPAGTKFGALELGGVRSAASGLEFVGATPDLRHVVLAAPQSLVEGFNAGEGNLGEDALYEWSPGQGGSRPGTLAPISILPHGVSASVERGAKLGGGSLDIRNAISANGSRVFFESIDANHLFVRDMGKEETEQLDAPEAGAAGGLGSAVFQLANAEGTKAFFIDTARLTTDATGNEREPDLYMCEVGEPGGHLACTLRDLTVDAHPGKSADVLGVVLGAGETAEDVYFVANGALAPGAVQGDCAGVGGSAVGECNLYVYDTITQHTRLIAVLSNADLPDWEAQKENLNRLTARVSPNGRFLAFMSQRSLTGYDNRDAVSGAADEEVYLYDAASGRLTCASCDPTGARPVGLFESEDPLAPELLVDSRHLWAGQTLAGSVPGWTSTEETRALYQSRYLDDDGRLFLDSPEGLAPQDANGLEDVYEYEPQGVGPAGARCEPGVSDGSEVYEPGRTAEVEGRQVEEGSGCVGLISSGTSGEETAFLDASATGPGGEESEDVFFLTTARLSPADVDSALDAYDAHICSTATPCPSTETVASTTCAEVAECRGSSSAESASVGQPPSATLTGSGNVPLPAPAKAQKTAAQIRAEQLAKALKVCRVKRNKHRRQSCEAQARKRYDPPLPKARKKHKPTGSKAARDRKGSM